MNYSSTVKTHFPQTLSNFHLRNKSRIKLNVCIQSHGTSTVRFSVEKRTCSCKPPIVPASVFRLIYVEVKGHTFLAFQIHGGSLPVNSQPPLPLHVDTPIALYMVCIVSATKYIIRKWKHNKNPFISVLTTPLNSF